MAPPPAPKRPLASFFLFKQDVYEQVKKENPNSKITELTKIISDKWKDVDDKVKEKYQKLHLEAKKKYDKELAEYVNRYGQPQKKQKRKQKKKN